MLQALYTELFDQRVVREGTLLKTNMVVSGYDASEQADTDTVAEMTIRCLKNTCPGSVPGVVFLSGGMSDEDATARLNAMNQRGPHPWELSFSYGRALQAPALEGLGRRHEQSGRCAKGVLPAGEVQRRSAFRRVRARVGDGGSRLTRKSSSRTSSASTKAFGLGTSRACSSSSREDAELAFEGVAVGPFRGKPAIAQAYAEQPPDDEIVILRARESGEDLVVADYAWRAEPASRAGSMILRLRGAEIDRLLVTFG